MANTYTLTVLYLVKDGKGREFVQKLEKGGFANKVRREKGCLRYDYYFKSWDEDTVLLFEEWESKAHQEAHMTQPHVKEFLELKNEYVVHTTLYDRL